MSFTEVGKHMSCSAEYGRKLCHKALEKLWQAAEAGTLELALMLKNENEETLASFPLETA